jgi:molecular chaperone DnaK
MLFEHVCAVAGVPLSQIDPNDPRIVPEVARLRRECTQAKEALSVDTDTTIPVALGGVRRPVRVTRAEFEEMIRPDLDRTIEALHRALESAAIDGPQLDAILLVGGSSQIPLVSQLISAEFDQAPAIDTHPKTTVAIGAARFLAAVPEPSEDSLDTDFQLPAIRPERPRISTVFSGDEDSTAEPVQHRSRKAVLGAAGVVLLLAGAAALGSPKLADALRHSAASPGTTSSAGSTPTPGHSAGPAGAEPHSTTSGSAPSAVRSNADGLAAQKPATSTPTTSPAHSSPAVSGPSPTPTPVQNSPTPTPTRTRRPTPPPTTAPPTTPSPTTTPPTAAPPTTTPGSPAAS